VQKMFGSLYSTWPRKAWPFLKRSVNQKTFISIFLIFFVWITTRVGTKTLFWPFAKTKTFTKGAAVFVKFRQFFAKVFCKNFSRKPQSDKKWYQISVEKEYMEPDPWFLASWIRICRIRIRSGSWSYLRKTGPDHGLIWGSV
jgi:hypothetical protein